jgi:hypothetical protein
MRGVDTGWKQRMISEVSQHGRVSAEQVLFKRTACRESLSVWEGLSVRPACRFAAAAELRGEEHRRGKTPGRGGLRMQSQRESSSKRDVTVLNVWRSSWKAGKEAQRHETNSTTLEEKGKQRMGKEKREKG